MCQAEVAHHASHIPEFFISRRVHHTHLYRKMVALTCRIKTRAAEEEYEWGEDLGMGRGRWHTHAQSLGH